MQNEHFLKALKSNTTQEQSRGKQGPYGSQPGQGNLGHILGVGSLELAVSAAFLALRLDAVN